MAKDRPERSPAPPGHGQAGKSPNWRAWMLAGVLGGVCTVTLSGAVVGQGSNRPHISIDVAPTIVAAPAAQTPLAIEIRPREVLPRNSFVRLRGLPPAVALTEGYAIGPGSWAVPLSGLSALKVNVPTDLSGRTEIVITVVGMDGVVLAEAKAAVVFGRLPILAPSENMQKALRFQLEDKADPKALPAPRRSAKDKARAENLLARGEASLANGNVEIARQFFLRAVDAGLAAAALRLGATYDPTELARLKARGIAADRALARKWYERAKDLGAAEAMDRLAKLGGN
jgi:hypothetical protein